MDRNLIDIERAWEQQMSAIRRELSALSARVGSSAVVVAEQEIIEAATFGSDTSFQPTLLTVGVQPGRWIILLSAFMLGDVAPTTAWGLTTHLADRATQIEFSESDSDALPRADVTHPAAAADVGVTLSSHGWVAVEPSDHPDGFLCSARLGVVSGDFPDVYRVRLALLPF